jgi:hypothetical protein
MKVRTTMAGVQVERDERPIPIRCCGCKRVETATRVDIIPPAGIGAPIQWNLMPDGWWAPVYLNTLATKEDPAAAQCPDCLRRLGRIDGEAEQSATSAEIPQTGMGGMAQRIKGEVERALADWRTNPRTFEEETWRKTLGTIDGAATVAEALAKHIRGKTNPRRPEDISDCRGTSVEKVVEALEACSARLQEFRAPGSPATDLSILGPRPFAERPSPGGDWCSFCGKAQEDVQKLIAGAAVRVCNECVDLCNELIAEERAEEDAKAVRQE